MNSILNKEFRYTPAASTDIRKLFTKVRRELKEKAEAEKAAKVEAQQKVRRITR